jgi:hypothetical protein
LDHIVPVAEGGGDEDSNLIAACSDCNHGKHARIIDAASIPRDYKAMGLDAKERAAQLAEYRKHLESLRAEVDQSIDLVGVAFWGQKLTWDYVRGMKERGQVERFINLLGLGEIEGLARYSKNRFPDNDRESRSRFRYFCRCCWNRCTELGIRGGGGYAE